jgi:hypothetical protein
MADNYRNLVDECGIGASSGDGNGHSSAHRRGYHISNSSCEDNAAARGTQQRCAVGGVGEIASINGAPEGYVLRPVDQITADVEAGTVSVRRSAKVGKGLRGAHVLGGCLNIAVLEVIWNNPHCRTGAAVGCSGGAIEDKPGALWSAIGPCFRSPCIRVGRAGHAC